MMLTSKTFTTDNSVVKVFFFADRRLAEAASSSEIMKNLFVRIAVLAALILAGFAPAPGDCGSLQPSLSANRCGDLFCCAENTAESGNPARTGSSNAPASSESSCDLSQLSSDAALASLIAVAAPSHLSVKRFAVEDLLPAAGHTLPLLKPPQR